MTNNAIKQHVTNTKSYFEVLYSFNSQDEPFPVMINNKKYYLYLKLFLDNLIFHM